MSPMKTAFETYVHQLTGQVVVWKAPLRTPLPGYLDKLYAPYRITLDRHDWLAVELKTREPPPPLILHKQLAQLAARMNFDHVSTCLVAEHLPPYVRGRLVELGQPFVIPGRQLFWPALGSAETTQRPRRLRPEPVQQLSPVAQQLLIALLLSRLPEPITVSTAAEALGCTAMSVSRAIKALEAGQLAVSEVHGRERSFALADAPRQVWQRALPMLRTPVLRRARVAQDALPDWITTRAGESALAEFSDLAAPHEPVFAAASRVWSRLASDVAQIPVPDEGSCRIELWRYPPQPTAASGCADPLSLYLSLREQPDERVQLALEQLMEQLPW